MMTVIVLFSIAVAIFIVGLILTRSANAPRRLSATYEGPVAEYRGTKRLVVAVYARWASVWRATAEALAGLELNHYDLKLVNADKEPEFVAQYRIEIIPTVLVFENGHEIARLPNMMSLDQLPPLPTPAT